MPPFIDFAESEQGLTCPNCDEQWVDDGLPVMCSGCGYPDEEQGADALEALS